MSTTLTISPGNSVMIVNADTWPGTDDMYDLGSSSLRWETSYTSESVRSGASNNVSGVSSGLGMFGSSNTIDSSLYTVVAGSSNVADTANNGLISGNNNSITASARCAIVGASSCTIDSSDDVLVSGTSNVVEGSSDASAVVGGLSNGITGSVRSVIVGSRNSTISTGVRNAIVGGFENEIITSSNDSGMLGGFRSIISGASNRGGIVGGLASCIDCTDNAGILGGDKCTLADSSNRSVIVGGFENQVKVTSTDASVIGGFRNVVTGSSARCSIVGGLACCITNTAVNSILAGGDSNVVDDATNGGVLGSTVVTLGVSDRCSIISNGGSCITGNSSRSALVAGNVNEINGGDLSSIISGSNSCITGSSENSVIAAGNLHEIDGGIHSAIVGGENGTMQATRSVAIKCNATARTYGTNDRCYIDAAETHFYGDLVPDTDDTHDLGTTSLRWQTGYLSESVRVGSSNNVSGVSDGLGMFGLSNTIDTSLYAVVSGSSNVITSSNNSIITGNGHSITGSARSSIVGGQSNEIAGGSNLAIVGGTGACITAGANGGIFCGQGSTVSDGTRSVIVGGFENLVLTTSTDCGILGGFRNSIESSSARSAILGGLDASITGTQNGGILSGEGGTISSSSRSVVMGGFDAQIQSSSTDASIVGGFQNSIVGSSARSAIITGQNNSITNSSSNSCIVSGRSHTIDGGIQSAIVGGRLATVQSDNSVVLKCNVTTRTYTTNDRCYIDAAESHFYGIIRGEADATRDVGSSSVRWRSGYYAAHIQIGDSNTHGGSADRNLLVGDTLTTNGSAVDCINTGSDNTITDSTHSAIVGSRNSQIDSSGETHFIGGGINNVIDTTGDWNGMCGASNMEIGGTAELSGALAMNIGSITGGSSHAALVACRGCTIVSSDESIIIGGRSATISSANNTVVLKSNTTARTYSTANSINLDGTTYLYGDLRPDTASMHSLGPFGFPFLDARIGNLTLTGSTITAGGAANININSGGLGADMVLQATAGAGNVRPAFNNTTDLGETSFRWAKIWGSEIDIGTGNVDSTTGGSSPNGFLNCTSCTISGTGSSRSIMAGTGNTDSSSGSYKSIIGAQDSCISGSGQGNVIISGQNGNITGGNFACLINCSSSSTTNSTAGRLHVRTSNEVRSEGHIRPSASNTYDLGSSGQRWREIFSNMSLNTSDRREKDDIVELQHGLAVVMQLNPVSFRWKQGCGRTPVDKKEFGLIAQEVEAVVPDVIRRATDYPECYTNDDGSPLEGEALEEKQQEYQDDLRSINNGAVTALLINAVKDLNRERLAQDARIDSLEATVQTQQAQIDQLTQQLAAVLAVIHP